MKDDYTHISVILDRTGSMQAIRDDTIGGFNTFLEEQKSHPGYISFTLVQFDSQNPYEVIHHFQPIKKVPELSRRTYVPRAQTPLLDAIGRGINDLEHSIAELPQKEKPSKTLFVIITDGHENASREFNKKQIEKMIREKSGKSDWQFVYLSADVDAFDDAGSYGIPLSAVLKFRKGGRTMKSAWTSLSRHASDYHVSRRKVEFDEEDRKNAE